MILPINYDNAHWSVRKAAREQYVKQQKGLCWYCNSPLKDTPRSDVLDWYVDKNLFPPNFFKYPVHLHHNHNTGMTIGAVHNVCNAVLWQYHGE